MDWIFIPAYSLLCNSMSRNYPIYGLTPPAGMYGHVEPVVGIQSNHPLNDTTVYDDDVAVHFTDGGTNTVHRVISTLPGTWAGVGQPAKCGDGYSYCIGPWSFGWAVTGFADDVGAVEASLHIEPWQREPNTREGAAAIPLRGTVTATGLAKGASYDVYRWDSSADALTYAARFKKATFVASGESHVWADSASFQSSSTTYYRVVPSKH